MDKQFLSAIELLKIAAQHAYCAEHLLKQEGKITLDKYLSIDALLPITSLMHHAFELTLRAYLMQDYPHVRQYRTLLELIELNNGLGLSREELQLITRLTRQQSFRKGIDQMQWQNRQQLHVFCEEIMSLFAHLQTLMPLELQTDYQ